MRIEYVAMSAIQEWPQNPKLHADAVLDASLERFGYVAPLLRDEGTGRLVAGHGRLDRLVARKTAGKPPPERIKVRRGEWMVPVICGIAFTSAEEAEAYLLADNQTTILGGWKDADLAPMLERVRATAGQFSGVGFTAEHLAEIKARLAPPPNLDEGPAVDPADEILTKWAALGCVAGSLWEIPSADGQRVHRVLCGDALSALHRVRLLGGATPETLIYDPPWDAGVMIDAGAAARHRSILAFGDGARVGEIVRMFGAPAWLFGWDCVTSWYTPNRPLKRMKLCAFYGAVADYDADAAHYGTPAEAKDVSNPRGTYRYQPDPRGKHLSDLFQRAITAEHETGTHRHEKPLDWMRMLIGNCTRGAVYDPYGGRGTSLLAAEQLDRVCYLSEIEPGHVAATLERISRAGLTPRLVTA